jgi:hypothetical protein
MGGMKRLNAWFNRNPLLAVYLGLIAAFALMYVAVPMLVRHVEHVARSAT